MANVFTVLDMMPRSERLRMADVFTVLDMIQQTIIHKQGRRVSHSGGGFVLKFGGENLREEDDCRFSLPLPPPPLPAMIPPTSPPPSAAAAAAA